MTVLAEPQRQRLIKLLAMSGSEHAGERDAAVLAANRLLQKCGATWAEFVALQPAEKNLPDLGTWRRTGAPWIERPGTLRKWEISFLHDLPGFQRLAVKQRYCLREIGDRVLGDRK